MEALGQLTGGIAHDFNNLLTVVSGNLELAESLISDEKTLKYLRKSMAAVDAGASINKRLLSFAMQRKLKPKCMYLNERIIDIFKLLQRTLGEQVQIEHELDPNAWPTVADAGEIDSAIINIALNSRDAMPRGGKISIKLSNVSINKKRAIELNGQDGDYVCLSIRDTGEGMAAEVLSRCMDPFFTTKDTGKGVGLGLSSVYGLTRQLGGFINISSFMGKGTTVSIYLKRAQSIDKYNWSSGHVGSIVPGNGEQILIVEDQDDIRDITAERLKVLGYSVIVAKSGAEAIHILESSIHIDLVFSDVIMPGEVSGYDILAWIRNNRPEMHVLLTSGYEPSQEIGHLDMKCVRTLNKPYTQSQISTEIYRALNEVTRN